jgi:hypothetical protein
MPGGDGTGPAGMGPMTGRAAGFCAGYSVPGYANPVGGRGFRGFGRGMGHGRGFGRGFARGFGFAAGNRPYPNAAYPYNPAVAAQPTAQQEMEALKQQAQYLTETLEDINSRIKQLDQSKED